MELNDRRALVINHEPDGPAGQVGVRLTERGFIQDVHIVTQSHGQPNVAAPFPPIDPYDLLVFMGSIHSLTRKEEIDTWIYDELALIRRAHDAELPMLGICFGGQLISEALGGSVSEAPETELGWFSFDAVGGQENPVGPGPWMEWHHDRFTPPPDADVLATTPAAIQLFRIGRSVGTQFHPEVDVDHIRTWLRSATDDYLATYGTDRETVLADAIEHSERSTKGCHAFVDWFLDSVAFP